MFNKETFSNNYSPDILRDFEDILLSRSDFDEDTNRLISELERMFGLRAFFHRHFEPRPDQWLLEGPSWREVLGISRYKFNKAFANVGVSYSSWDDVPKGNDMFQGKYYCRVFIERHSRRTVYFRNTKLISEIMGIWDFPEYNNEDDFNLTDDERRVAREVNELIANRYEN